MFIRNKNENTYFLDFLRVLSCFAVVVLHVNINYLNDLSNLLHDNMMRAMDVNSRIVTFAVPMFLTITGYIFLGLKNECTYKSLRKYLIKFIVIWFVAGTLFNILEYIFLNKTFDLSFIKTAFIEALAGNTWDHLWYIKTIFFIYLLLPIFKPFFNKDNNNSDLIIFIAIFALEVLVLPKYNAKSPIKVLSQFPIGTDVLYVLLGGLLYKYKFNNNFSANLISALLLILIAILNYVFFDSINFLSLTNRYSLANFIVVILLFNLCRNIISKNYKLISFLAKHTLYIYVFHVAILHVFTKMLHYSFLIDKNVIISEYILAIIIFSLTLIVSIIIKSISSILRPLFSHII